MYKEYLFQFFNPISQKYCSHITRNRKHSFIFEVKIHTEMSYAQLSTYAFLR